MPSFTTACRRDCPTTSRSTRQTLTHAVLAALAERLTPDEAAELGAELPDELGDLLAARRRRRRARAATSSSRTLAARLDLDDDDAETGALGGAGRVCASCLEPVVAIEQVLETLAARSRAADAAS